MTTHAIAVSRKGQITLPKKLRESINLDIGNLVLIKKEGQSLKVTKTNDILNYAGYIKSNAQNTNKVLTAREKIDTSYERF